MVSPHSLFSGQPDTSGIWPLESLRLLGSLAGVGMCSVLDRHDGTSARDVPPLSLSPARPQPHTQVVLPPEIISAPPSESTLPLLFPGDLACASISMVYLFPTSEVSPWRADGASSSPSPLLCPHFLPQDLEQWVKDSVA